MWNRNFLMVVIGQIISLFGIVSACAFIPMIVLSPIGGIFADRVNKRNIMVVLDFATALIILGIVLLLTKMNLVMLLLGTMILLYGIQGAYQPAVQASIPVLLKEEHIMPILYVSAVCFLLSAIMEIFIHIPYEKKQTQGNIFVIGFTDLKESFHYMSKEQPLIIKLSLAMAAINMILSVLIIIGLPVIVTQMLAFNGETANRLYGYAEGVMALGSLCGGMGAGMLADKMKTRNGWLKKSFIELEKLYSE